ncbi:MAG: efflux RND transporter periplasmic adaptor subunit [Planctomycetaceae bacterium]|nr:efflux RND transporter periplasmic adaptor subunit [Planctomycetaceae bacterium]
MSFLVKTVVILLVIVGLGWATYQPAMTYFRERNKPTWETAKVIRGDAKRIINSTGKIEPVLKVSIGAFVSGPIVELHVDFNDEVTEGQLLAKVDPLLYQAAVDRDQASLTTREAEVVRVEAQLLLAKNNLERGLRLREKDERYLSDRELDGLKAEFAAQEALLKVAKASILQAQAQLNNSQTNLNYCDIRSPVNGVVLARKIDPGQTLASQFQTPELFVVAPDLRKKLHVFATVDESDIGLIRRAYDEQLPVSFTVDAYPGDKFVGRIEQIRYEATELQNVITYPVVVATENPELKLLPSMTAQLSFEVSSVENVLQIPNTALRYYPENIALVREADRKLLDGSQWNRDAKGESEAVVEAEEKVGDEAAGNADEVATDGADKVKTSNVRHVWIVKDNQLQAIEVKIGFSDSRYTVVESGEVTEGMELVTGVKK